MKYIKTFPLKKCIWIHFVRNVSHSVWFCIKFASPVNLVIQHIQLIAKILTKPLAYSGHKSAMQCDEASSAVIIQSTPNPMVICSMKFATGPKMHIVCIVVWQSSQFLPVHIDGLVQERGNSSASAMELSVSCTNPSILCLPFIIGEKCYSSATIHP